MAQTKRDEIETLVRARYPILYVVSWEEDRVIRDLRKVADAREKKLFVWSNSRGMQAHTTLEQGKRTVDERSRDPLVALDTVLDHMEPALFALLDFHYYMNDPGVARKVRDVAASLKSSYKTAVIVSPTLKIPFELQKDITVIDYDLPGIEELGALLDARIKELNESSKLNITIAPAIKEKILYAAKGLTLNEAENVFAKTLVSARRLTEAEIPIILSEKEQAIRKSGILEYYRTDEAFSDVGGLDNLKRWLTKRARAFGEEARSFGLPSPKGVLLLGIQGCGKSLCAKAVSSLWRLPLLRLDVGKVFSDLVGSSERNIREAIVVGESVAPAILWVDEIEKAFAGTQSSSFSDAGTTSRVFGTFLTWLQEKTAPVFVIATANNIQQLPPELLRKGRLDEIFFVDLPTKEERAEILNIHLRKHHRDPENFDLDKLAGAAEGFSGAELEEAVISALFDVFDSQTNLSTEALLRAINETVPLSTTVKEEIERLRQWASGRARRASSQEAEEVPAYGARKLEL